MIRRVNSDILWQVKLSRVRIHISLMILLEVLSDYEQQKLYETLTLLII